MDRNQFLRQINSLRRQGKSIRAIAAELGVDRGRVARGLQALADFNTGAFVGRQKEMAELRATLDDVFSGRGRLVMLAGEPGIGKTRTAEELSAYAKTLGAHVLWGRCQDGGGAPPYWPWVRLLRSYVRNADPETLRGEMGHGAADIGEIVPELRAKLSGLERPPVLDPQQAQFRLFDSITAFLLGAAQRRPLVLVLDDLHWADSASLGLLDFLAGELTESHLLIVGAYRDVELSRRHPLAETLGSLMRESASGGFRRIQLERLTLKDIDGLIQATTGVAPAAQLAKVLHFRTEGNPLFATEILRTLGPDPELDAERLGDHQGLRVGIPEGVREVIGRRLNRLSHSCNRVLATASVIGKEFEFELLHALSDHFSEGQLLAALDEALQAGVIEETAEAMESYRFRHVLIQETLSEELSASRRVRLHARIGETLEELYRGALEARPAQLAHHFAQAEPVTGPDKLVRYSLMAGERALAAYAYEDALSHFQRVLAAKKGRATHEPSDDETAALLRGLGRAQAATFERHSAQEGVDNLVRASTTM